MSLLTQPSELKHNQPISCLIYGQPGTGKTTLALSADKPVLIDLDRGLYRVEKRFQCPSLQVENYQQILDLINSDELRPFNTIVIDTLGKLVDRMGDFVARQNPKFKQGDGTLSMKAWGAIKIQFAALVKQIFNSNKSVIFVAHEKEDKDGDIRFVRPDVSGSSGKDIVKELDLMGYMEMKGNKRTVSFTPNEKYYAKNALNLPPVIEVPDTTSGNTFFQDKIVAAVAEKRRQEAELLADYESLKNVIETKVGEIKDITGLNEVYGEIRGLQVIWDSQIFANKMLKEKATNVERRQLAETGILRCAFLLRDDIETIHAATDLLAEAKLSPELRNEALYYRAKAYTKQKADKKAMEDYRELAKDTRNSYGAEAKYQVAQSLYDAKEYAAAEKELLNYIEQSTPHAYWLARSFILLSDVYHATGKDLDARQYLLSLQQNYQGNDDIESMIESRLQKLKTEN